MAGGTNRGNEVLARVATRLDVAMAANVVSFAGLSPFVVTRQVVGGAALEEMRAVAAARGLLGRRARRRAGARRDAGAGDPQRRWPSR